MGDLGFSIPDVPEPEVSTAPILVSALRPEGPAMQAGVEVGSEIVSVDGYDVRNDRPRFGILTRVGPGRRVELGFADGSVRSLVAVEAR